MTNPASQTPVDIKSGPFAGARSHFVAIGTSKLHYLTLGSGATTLIFLHGWACHLDFWREQASAFADRARLVFIDLPGHGQSGMPEQPCTLDFHAQAVAAVLAEAEIERAVFIGHSRGAAVLCRLYALMPEKFAGMVSVEGLLCRLPATPDLVRQFIGQFHGQEWRENARKFFGGFFPVPGTERLREEILNEMLKTSQTVIAEEAESIASLAQPDWALPGLDVPLLVLNARSPLWSERYEHYVKSLSVRVDYRVLEGVGHFLMLEKPAEFNAQLLDGLKNFGLLTE